MNFNKKLSLLLLISDILIITMVVVIKSNSTINIDKKDIATAANVLSKSDDALNSYKTQEIEEYFVEKKEEGKGLEESKKEEVIETNNTSDNSVIENSDAEKKEQNLAPAPDSSYTDVASYATQFVGNPYVSGGTSLTDGADCSGFVMSVYSNFGVSLPRTSSEQSTVGYEVSVDEIQAGDIVSYGYNGSVSHSAIYIGDGTIVHASTPDLGIRTDNMYIMPIVTVRRVG